MANSADPDQTAPSGAVWSGFALFAYAILPYIFVLISLQKHMLWVLISSASMRHF